MPQRAPYDHSNCHWKLLYQMSTSLNLKMTQEGLIESIGSIVVHQTDYESFHWHWVRDGQLVASNLWSHYEEALHTSLHESFENPDNDIFQRYLSDIQEIKMGSFLSLDRAMAPFKHVMAIPVSIGGDRLAVLQFFSTHLPPIADSEQSLIADLIGVEVNRQLELYYWKERERDEVLQLAQASRLSALGAMAGGIAHEINNPLTIIMGTIKLTIKELKDATEINRTRQIEILEKAKQYAERINKIVKGIRALSRDGSKDSFHLATIQEIVDNTLALCEAAIQTNEIQLSYDIEEPEKEIECRPVQISQVLLNLINNSMDAIGDKKNPWIHVAVRSTSEGKIEFSVTDSGAGIPEAIAFRLMQPFFTTKGAGKGTGLGLSISQEIIKAHSGTFYLDRESPNTRFVMEIPALQSPA